MKLKILYLLLLFPIYIYATTWGESEVADPILKGEICKVQEPMSFGGYIYAWPSKYDQVFWPLTDENGIWFCEKSGFIAFIGDFKNLNSNEIDKIKKYLKNNPPKKRDIKTKLLLLENIYALRDTNKRFKNHLLRVLARWYQNLGDYEKANALRKMALIDIKKQLEGKLDELNQLEYLYLAANYSRQLGDQNASDIYFNKLNQSIDAIQKEEVKDFAEYLKKFMNDTKFIKNGGAIDPKVPK